MVRNIGQIVKRYHVWTWVERPFSQTGLNESVHDSGSGWPRRARRAGRVRVERLQSALLGERRKAWLTVLSLVLLPLVVKAPLLLQLLDADPMRNRARLSPVTARGPLWGVPTTDQNIGVTGHALGSLAARLWATGTPPWWSPYEGVGTPLAGEMQSAALFPPTLLTLLPGGQLLEHLLFQIVAGLAAFALLRRLGAGRTGAWLGGTSFAFNGAFAWLANAAINPVCFLPVVRLGIEMLSTPAPRAARAGGALVALGLAASLYAGFPKVAYLNGLLIGAWTIVRGTTRSVSSAESRCSGSAACCSPRRS